MKEIKTYEEILGNRDVDAQPEILEIDSIKFDIVRGGEIQNLSFTDLSLAEKQTVLNECSTDELKRTCLILADRLRCFKHPYILQKYVEMQHIFLKYRVNLKDNNYLIVFYDDTIGRNGCFLYNDSLDIASEYELKRAIGESILYDDEYEDSNIEEIFQDLQFDIHKVNRIFEFCESFNVRTEDFFNAFYKYFKDTTDKNKISQWIDEIIAPTQKPKLVENFYYDK